MKLPIVRTYANTGMNTTTSVDVVTTATRAYTINNTTDTTATIANNTTITIIIRLLL